MRIGAIGCASSMVETRLPIALTTVPHDDRHPHRYPDQQLTDVKETLRAEMDKNHSEIPHRVADL
jgi:hypothetical protein